MPPVYILGANLKFPNELWVAFRTSNRRYISRWLLAPSEPPVEWIGRPFVVVVVVVGREFVASLVYLKIDVVVGAANKRFMLVYYNVTYVVRFDD